MIYIHHQEIDGIWYAVALDGEKVFATAFSYTEKEVLRHLLQSLPYNVSFQIAEESNQLSIKLLKMLKAIFDGKNVSFSLKTAMNHLSSYAQKVLHCVSLIPAGYLTTYSTIAKAMGGSPRAVGQVMASNPFPLVIPCHRVVRADFSIGGYGLGEKFLKRKIEVIKNPRR